jgi:hypothetical protein
MKPGITSRWASPAQPDLPDEKKSVKWKVESERRRIVPATLPMKSIPYTDSPMMHSDLSARIQFTEL